MACDCHNDYPCDGCEMEMLRLEVDRLRQVIKHVVDDIRSRGDVSRDEAGAWYTLTFSGEMLHSLDALVERGDQED